MSEPHIIVEREYDWDEFISLLFESKKIVRIEDRLYSNDSFFRSLDGYELKFYNGPYVPYRFLKIFNETIKYGSGVFHLEYQVFDTVETDEMEEVWLMDGMVEDRPIIKTLETYKLEKVELQLYSLEKY